MIFRINIRVLDRTNMNRNPTTIVITIPTLLKNPTPVSLASLAMKS